MNSLSEKIEEMISIGQSFWLEEQDGSLLNITPSINKVRIIHGNGSDYLEVVHSDTTILYNLNMTKSIRIAK